MALPFYYSRNGFKALDFVRGLPQAAGFHILISSIYVLKRREIFRRKNKVKWVLEVLDFV